MISTLDIQVVQSNGAVEKFNACLKSSLKTLTDRFPDSWDNALCWILFGYREVVNETTDFSPFSIVVWQIGQRTVNAYHECDVTRK